MKYIWEFILIFILITTIVNGQSSDFFVKVNYDYTLQMLGPESKYLVGSVLTFNSKESIYEIDHTHSLDNIDVEFNGEQGSIFNVKSNNNDFVYKNMQEKTMYYSNLIGFKKIFIKDSLNIMNWTLTVNKKNVLGYMCQEATTSYGGRNYTAYFTSEISISNGPWRFNGLPGLILEVSDTDGVFKINATNLIIRKDNVEIENPYKEKKLLSWNDFLSLYKLKYEEVLRNGMTEFGSSTELAKKSIIEYIKE
ncbi:MAG: GLPGLI family protein [Lutibacter sp.]|nr:GLPGLI family protein [Lutibacter sp.]